MERKTKLVLTALTGAGLLAGGLTACVSQADTASRNISVDAENFKVQRRIAVINGITDKILLEAEGEMLCRESRSGPRGRVIRYDMQGRAG